jgi:hypothetical protein
MPPLRRVYVPSVHQELRAEFATRGWTVLSQAEAADYLYVLREGSLVRRCFVIVVAVWVILL